MHRNKSRDSAFAISIILFLVIGSPLFAQTRADNWYFGDYLGIQFTQDSILSLTNSQARVWEGCASISERNGDLYFYSGIWTGGSGNYNVLWNKNHEIMANSHNLLSHSSASQGMVACPNPADSNEHYLFHFDLPWGGQVGYLYYSVLNHELDGGLGDIDNSRKNILLKESLTEHMTAVRKSDSSGYWLITHQNPGTELYVFDISATGIDTMPQITNGIRSATITHGGSGNMKASLDGTKLAMCHRGDGGFVELFSFNPATGQISEPILLDIPVWGGIWPYGLEFSANSQVLYVCDNAGLSTNEGTLAQWDVSTHDSATIANSFFVVDDSIHFEGGMQIGPDSMIYLTADSGLHRIENPNALGSSCDFVSDYMSFEAETSFGLPNLPTFYFDKYNVPTNNTDTTDSTYFVNVLSTSDEEIIRVFPNPCHDSHNIEFVSSGEYIIDLFDPTGTRIRQIFKGHAERRENVEVEVQKLPPGVYSYIVYSIQGIRVTKIVIE